MQTVQSRQFRSSYHLGRQDQSKSVPPDLHGPPPCQTHLLLWTACFSLGGNGCGSSGSGGGGGRVAHLDSVSVGNASHLAHTHTHTHIPSLPLQSPPQHLLLPLEWVSSSCWQRWQAQCREPMGEGAAAAAVARYICPGPWRNLSECDAAEISKTHHVWDHFMIRKPLGSL